MAKARFEECLKRLEHAIARLEEDDLSLETSLELFEEGIQASKQCAEMLAQARARIEKLVNEGERGFRLQPLDE